MTTTPSKRMLISGISRPVLTAVLIGALVLAACGSGDGAGPDEGAGAEGTAAPEGEPAADDGAPFFLDLGFTARHAGYWSLYIAQEMGFYEQENLIVSQVVLGDQSSETQAVLSGSLAMSSGTPEAYLLANAQGRGEPTQAIFAIRNVPVETLVGAPEIESIEDLRGQALGVAELTASGAWFTKEMLRIGAGLEEGDYDLISVGGTPSRAAALESGGVQAALLGPPHDQLLLQRGYNALGVTAEVIEDFAWAWGVTTVKWAQENEEVVIAFIRAIKRATDWFYDEANQEEAIRILMDETGVDEEAARETYDIWIRYEQLVPDMRPSDQGLLNLIDLMSESDHWDDLEPPTPEEFINRSYLDAALDSLDEFRGEG